MNTRIIQQNQSSVEIPAAVAERSYSNAKDAVAALLEIYQRNTAFLREKLVAVGNGVLDGNIRYRSYYPEVRIKTSSFSHIDSRLSYGHVTSPGNYAATITRPDLFQCYLEQQLDLLIRNHGVDVIVAESDTPIPLHFAFGDDSSVEATAANNISFPLRDLFDVPDLNITDDMIVNGTYDTESGAPLPLAAFTAQRVDYSLARLSHYTATLPEHFQNFVLFTNYQFYVEEFCAYAKALMADGGSGYTEFVEPGNVITRAGETETREDGAPGRLPQMPAYHLKRGNHTGITMINIGVGPSNAKTITDHVAVLRPHSWLMLGHCAGLRNSQQLGDYVLAHAYVREDHVLDDDLPIWVPIPALAEVQVAMQEAVAEITGLEGYDLKRIMRTGTVATIDNRNWELRDQSGPVHRLSLSRAIALDMESATIAANGFRFRVPYGTLLCVSDKPLHGELKLPGMATEFYRTQVNQHLKIGILALEKLASMPPERLHSRKLRSFFEPAFQ